jgi:enoyl-CoA hydratase/carnithine racemase
MSPHARREDADGVVTITFTRPDKRNAVSRQMFDMIADAVRDLRDQDDLRVLVLTAEGEYYTGGKDVGDLRTRVGEGTDGIVRGSNMRAQYRRDADHDLFDAIEQVEKPVILAAQGHCLGVGVEMGSSCDFRFAAEGATFALPEVKNLAVLPGSGGVSRLTRIVGPHWARWLAMACEPVDAHQALAIGLVHAVYPAEELAERVQAFARKLAGMPREALGVAKVAIDTADTVDRATARVFDRFSQTLLFTSDEFKDRVNAFNRASAARGQQRQAQAVPPEAVPPER